MYLAPPPPPTQPPRKMIRVQPKEEPMPAKKLPVQQKVAVPVRKEVVIEPMIPLESFYYGMYETGTENDSAAAVTFEANVRLACISHQGGFRRATYATDSIQITFLVSRLP